MSNFLNGQRSILPANIDEVYPLPVFPNAYFIQAANITTTAWLQALAFGYPLRYVWVLNLTNQPVALWFGQEIPDGGGSSPFNVVVGVNTTGLPWEHHFFDDRYICPPGNVYFRPFPGQIPTTGTLYIGGY